MEDRSTFHVRDESGSCREYRILFLFQNDANAKNYIVYTDNTFSPKGFLNVFANIYEGELSNIRLYPIETEQEWNDVENLLALLDEDGQLDGSDPTDFQQMSDARVANFPPILEKGTSSEFVILALFTETLSQKTYVIVSDGSQDEKGHLRMMIGKVTDWDLEKAPSDFEEVQDPKEWSSIHSMVSRILAGLKDTHFS